MTPLGPWQTQWGSQNQHWLTPSQLSHFPGKGHVLRLQGWECDPVGVNAGGHWSMFLSHTYIDVSLSLSPHSSSLKSIKTNFSFKNVIKFK